MRDVYAADWGEIIVKMSSGDWHHDVESPIDVAREAAARLRARYPTMPKTEKSGQLLQVGAFEELLHHFGLNIFVDIGNVVIADEDELMEWCERHCVGKHKCIWCLYGFENENDAFAFRMRWC